MKKLLIILFISSLTSSLFGQSDTAKYYSYSDTTLWIGKTYIIDYLIFNLSGSYDGLLKNEELLDTLINFLNTYPKLNIELGCHSDNRRIPMTNDTLSLRRAESVKYYLINKGISENRINAVGYGSKKPRIIYENITITNDKSINKKCVESYSFFKNTVLDDIYIKSLHDYCKIEAAHKLNRRFEMKIIKTE